MIRAGLLAAPIARRFRLQEARLEQLVGNGCAVAGPERSLFFCAECDLLSLQNQIGGPHRLTFPHMEQV